MASLNELLDAFANRKRMPTIHTSLTSGMTSCIHVFGFGTYDAKGTDDMDNKVDITFFAADPPSFFRPNGMDLMHTLFLLMIGEVRIITGRMTAIVCCMPITSIMTCVLQAKL